MIDPLQADDNDSLAHFRNKFLIPRHNGKEQIYFLGNSLGLQPVDTSLHIRKVLDQWSTHGVEAFFRGDNRWLDFHDQLTGPLSSIAGCLPSEVVVMNHLTVNLHLLLATFYRPSKNKFKIICEANAFPSDQYMLESHVNFHGLDPENTIVEVHPRGKESIIRTEDISDVINKHANELALVLWGGVNYYTGQLFDIKHITELAHRAGAVAGFDLAHAVGNVTLSLHDWNVDFACWCSYKYLNSGPGGVGGAYIHERYHNDTSLPRLAGWWGYDKETRFNMQKGFRSMRGAEGWQLSTPPMILLAMHKAALDVFSEAGMEQLITKGSRLSDYLVYLLHEINREAGAEVIEVLTPSSKGCQVSMVVKSRTRQVFDRLSANGIFVDWRDPGVIRAAPVPLYNKYSDVFTFYQVMKNILLS